MTVYDTVRLFRPWVRPTTPKNKTLLASVVTNVQFTANRLIDESVRELKTFCTPKDMKWMWSNIQMRTFVFVKWRRSPVQHPSTLQRGQRVKLTTHWHLVQRLSRPTIRHQSAWPGASADLYRPHLHYTRTNCCIFGRSRIHIPTSGRLSVLKVFVVLLCFSTQMPRSYLKLHHDWFLLHHSQPVISPFEPTACNLGAFKSFLVITLQ